MIIDGSSDEYDGFTLGFNHFESVEKDEASDEIRRKIGDVRSLIYSYSPSKLYEQFFKM